MRAQVGGIERADVDTVVEDAAHRRIVEAQQQLEQGGLAGARRPDDGHGFTRPDREREVMQRTILAARGIGKDDAIEGQRTFGLGGKFGRRGGSDDLRLHRQKLADAARRAGGRDDLAPDFRELAERTGTEHRVEDKLRELTTAHPSCEDIVGAEPQHGDDAGKDQHDHDAGERRAGRDRLGRGGISALDRVAEPIGGHPLSVVGLHGADGAEALRGIGGGVGQRILRRARALADGATRCDERQDDDGQDHEDEGGKPGARPEHQRERAGEQEEVAKHQGRGRAERRLQLRRIRRETRDQFADPRAVIEYGIEPREMAEDVGPQVRDDPFAEGHHQEVTRARGHSQHGDDRQHGQEIRVDERRLVRGEAEVDDPPDRHRDHEGRGRSGGQRDECAGYAPPVADRVGKDRQQGAEIGTSALRFDRGRGEGGIAHSGFIIIPDWLCTPE